MSARRSQPDADPRRWYAYESHRKRRAHQLMVQPLCEICLQNGIATVATVADHIEPVAGSWMRFRTGRLQSLCTHCHGSTKRLLERDGYVREVGVDGWPVQRRYQVPPMDQTDGLS